ncbi:MAG: type IV toxin-antitoxin system AbiEi family antitoxin domain-containing protein [Myxococcaceae bacterium]
MNAATAYARLLSLELPVVRTSEASAVLGLTPIAAAQALRRLTRAGLVKHLRHGMVWVRPGPIDPWVALEFLTAPYPAYVSLFSALYARGVLSQIPVVHHAVSLGRTRHIRTSAGTYAVHQVAPALFGGFETLASGVKLATIEKALFDVAYLGGTRSRLFVRPPELELPKHLDRAELRRWLGRVGSPARRAQVSDRLDGLLRRSGKRALGR